MKWFIKGLVALIVLLVLLIIYANYQVSSCGNSVYGDLQDVPERDVALLLGTGKYLNNGCENIYFTRRIIACANLYHARKVKSIIVSGDNSMMDYNEPRDMRDALIEQGVKTEDIKLDFAGFRTFDSVVRAKHVFNIDQMIIVSQRYHCERAIYIAKHYQIDAIGFSADDVKGWPFVMRRIPRETFARFLAYLDVNVLGTQPRFIQ